MPCVAGTQTWGLPGDLPRPTPTQLESHRLLASPASPLHSSGHSSHSCTGTCTVLTVQGKRGSAPTTVEPKRLSLLFWGLPQPRLGCHPVAQNRGPAITPIGQLVQPHCPVASPFAPGREGWGRAGHVPAPPLVSFTAPHPSTLRPPAPPGPLMCPSSAGPLALETCPWWRGGTNKKEQRSLARNLGGLALRIAQLPPPHSPPYFHLFIYPHLEPFAEI